VRILGISGSPRLKGNTALLVMAALKGAEKVDGIQTEFISLADKNIKPCQGSCVYVCHPQMEKYERAGDMPDKGWELCRQKDDARFIFQQMAESNGIIIGSPVYFAGVPSQLKALMDRSTCLSQHAPEGGVVSSFRYKVGGAIAVGGARHGGQVIALREIVNYFLLLHMIPVGFAEYGDQSMGVAATASKPRSVVKDRWEDSRGIETGSLEQAEMFGTRVAEMVKIMEAGLSTTNYR
jgi:multimeric flavodoxin WrbA